MNAKGYFDVGRSAPMYRRNDFGGTIGGPLIFLISTAGRERPYFFFSEEARLESDPYAYRQAVPSVAERQGDFSDVCPPDTGWKPASLISAALNIQTAPRPDRAGGFCTGGLISTFANNTIPLNRNALLMLGTGIIPLPNATSGCNSTVASCYNAEVSLPTYWREELVRFDHAFTDTLRLNVHYIHDAWNTSTPVPQFAFTQNTFPTIQNDFYGPGVSAVARMTKTLSSYPAQ
jgi:hypothetical protein